MFTQKEFNKVINSSYNSKEKYIQWSAYREEISRFSSSSIVANGRTLIIGAGHLNDLDLTLIGKETKLISFIDIDMDAVEKGLKQQNIDLNEIKLYEKDISGLDNINFIRKILLILQADNLEGLEQYFETITDHPVDLGIGQEFDTILISSLYTQLLLPQFQTIVYQLFDDMKRSSAMECFMNFVPKIIRKVNATALQMMGPQSEIIVWSDLLEFRDEDKQLRVLIENIDNNEIIDQYYNDYVNKYGHGIGSYGLEELTEHIRVVDYKWLIWPFDAERRMLVKIIRGKRVENSIQIHSGSSRRQD